MATKEKIRINDSSDSRKELDGLYETADQIILAKWSLNLAKHILDLAGYDYQNNKIILDGFKTNELWQIGKMRMHDVRQSGFKIHQLAKESENEIVKAALRVTGHAVASGHMPEHAMVASDYAIKFINLKFPGDNEAIKNERLWQIDELVKNLRVN
jgi:hypothetical protein